MRLVTVLAFCFSLSALAQNPPPAQPIQPDDEEPIWLGDTPPPSPNTPVKLPPPRKGAPPVPPPMVIFHWVDAEGIDTYSDVVPPLYRETAVPIRGELAILQWSS